MVPSMNATSLCGCLQLISMQSSIESTLPIFRKIPECRPILRVLLYSIGEALHECSTRTGAFKAAFTELKRTELIRQWQLLN